MSELQDFELDTSSEDPRTKPPIWPYAAAVAMVILAVIAFLMFRKGEEPAVEPMPAEPAPVVEPAVEEEAGERPQVDLPPLEESDPWMREVVTQLSSHPKLAEWLVTDELIRRFVATVDNMAEGVSPRTHLKFMAPEESFRAAQQGSRQFISPTSYDRYRPWVQVLESVDVRGGADLYSSVKPLLDQSYRELGYPDREFQDTLTEAINQILSTPVVEGEIELEPRVSSYQFKDPELEALSPVQKHFLRLGPDNLRRLQNRLRELAVAIGIPQSRLVPPS